MIVKGCSEALELAREDHVDADDREQQRKEHAGE
jgi:hypothetical protein